MSTVSKAGTSVDQLRTRLTQAATAKEQAYAAVERQELIVARLVVLTNPNYAAARGAIPTPSHADMLEAEIEVGPARERLMALRREALRAHETWEAAAAALKAALQAEFFAAKKIVVTQIAAVAKQQMRPLIDRLVAIEDAEREAGVFSRNCLNFLPGLGSPTPTMTPLLDTWCAERRAEGLLD